ncbi:16S rRNA (guanine(527)-N(7))-methyltransferase RsmG [Betaproteobacteria bacterium GR16-43]|nr:16S rRNA (guanine(527)-N(7))-methyltransferase RsmG [Betaproteobacteria bacterium GR16-43]
MSVEQRIAEGVSAMGLTLPDDSLVKLEHYLELIAKWNRVHNLTAVREPDQMVPLHLLDSLSVLPHVLGAKSLLDVGTGAGLPGIPISIARPDLDVTLLDASHKKTAFLTQAKAELRLARVKVECERVERWKPDVLFDVVVSRAFSELADFVAQAKHLVAPGGFLLAMKGVHPFEEIAKVPASHRVDQVVELAVPSLDAKRHLVLLKAA